MADIPSEQIFCPFKRFSDFTHIRSPKKQKRQNSVFGNILRFKVLTKQQKYASGKFNQ